jgi:hypothetical protein
MLLKSRQDISHTEITQFPVANRLIKLPIENYLDILEIKPNSAQIAMINATNHPDIRFIVAVVSRRVGKTFISNVIGNLVALYPGTNVLIMAPNYSLASISWDLQLAYLRRFEISLTKCNAKDRIIELENGSSIRIGSVSQVDSCVGRSYDLIIFDEAALDNKGGDAFNVQLRPTLDKLNSKCIFISTPRGNNYFKDFYDLGFSSDEWFSVKADWRENPRATEKDIQSASKTMSNAHFRQEYYADFTSIQGKIYELPEDCICVRSVEVLDTIIGIDLGFRDPTSIIVCQTDGKSWHIIDCWEGNGLSTTQYAAQVMRLMDKYTVDFVYIDSANQQMKYDFAVEHDIYSINARKDVNLGIGYCQGLVQNGYITIDPSCTKVIEMLNNYSWDGREGILNEKPLHNRYSHMADAFRYAIYSSSYSFNPISDE